MSIIEKLLENFHLYAGKTALHYYGRYISYGELGFRAGQIAGYFQRNQISGKCIAIETDDISEHFASILGILLSGNYYLSITPENTHHIDAQFPVPIEHSLLSENDLQNPPHRKNNIFLSDITGKYLFTPPTIPFDSPTKFCVFITSGTGGKPKVIVHTHRTLNEDIAKQIALNHITNSDTLDLLFSLSFSVSLSCLFPALIAGATLCPYSIKNKGIDGLVAFWEENAVTYSSMSVSTFTAVCKIHKTLTNLAALRCVALGTEPVTERTIELFRTQFNPLTSLKIAYASTETRTISQVILANDDTLNSYKGSLGKVTQNKQVRIVGEDGKPLPPNSIGEIVVESTYIASGYIGNEPADKASFLRKGDVIVYKTGDLGYLDDDGELFFKGRKTGEVKINGITVDVALVENELEKMPGILRVAVVINNAIATKKSLVAFFLSSKNDLDFSQINSWIANKLPPGHYPHLYCKLVDFPLTHSGKTDRKKLEQLEFQPLGSSLRTENIPENELELLIIRAFNDALQTSNAKRDSSFFSDLGGDSLLSLVAIASIEQQLQIQLPAYSIWLYPTAATLAGFINSGLYKERVHVSNINQHKPQKRNLFFINRFRGGNDYKFLVNSRLADHFNLYHLLYDLENIEQIEPAGRVIGQIADLINNQSHIGGAILLGLSFHGFVAQQVATHCPAVRDCIFLDTYNYFELESYREKRTKIQNLGILVKNTILARNHIIFTSFIARRLKSNKNINNEVSPFRRNARHLFWHEYYREAAQNKKDMITHNCLYFRATHTFTTHPNHGYNWEKHVHGKFTLMNLNCGHLEITAEKNSRKIVDKIIETIEN